MPAELHCERWRFLSLITESRVCNLQCTCHRTWHILRQWNWNWNRTYVNTNLERCTQQ